jgi:hypothetical protein
MADKRRGLGVFLAIIVAALSSLVDCAHAGLGSIEALSGSSYYRAKGEVAWVGLNPGQSVDEGDWIKTGADGRVIIRLEDRTRLMLGNSTELELTEHKRTDYERSATYSLFGGKIRAVVTRFPGSTDIKVKTPTAVAGVKGTDFMVMNQNEANVVFGKEDTVHVSGLKDGQVRLWAGAMTENTRGMGPIEPVLVEKGTQLSEVMAQLEVMTDATAPIEWEKAGALPLMLARWNLNYGHYLADSRRYPDSLQVFQIAIDLTEDSDIRADGHLQRGTVFSVSLDEPEKALAEYREVIERYGNEPYLENAVFSTGKVYMGIRDKANALKFLRLYLQRYPNGAHARTAETLINSIEGW